MINLAIFLSGTGTNAKNIIQHFSFHKYISVKLIITNNPKSTLFETVKGTSIKYNVFDKNDFLDGSNILKDLRKSKISFIILAGFLLKIPNVIIDSFMKRIINIHPSLLPEFGGKGMYGMNVHKAVFNAKKKQTGITIHEVTPEYDKGRIIFQAKCELLEDDKPKDIQKKIQKLEHKFYPIVIENYILFKNEN